MPLQNLGGFVPYPGDDISKHRAKCALLVSGLIHRLIFRQSTITRINLCLVFKLVPKFKHWLLAGALAYATARGISTMNGLRTGAPSPTAVSM
jgi:hypothetical protein